MIPMNEAELFFHKHAGYSYDPQKETPEDGRQRGARELARDEKRAYDRGFYYRWSVGPHSTSAEFSDEKPAWRLWQCAMYNRKGQIVNSLHAIDFGRDGEPWGDPYRRVVEAELAADGLTNTPQGRAA